MYKSAVNFFALGLTIQVIKNLPLVGWKLVQLLVCRSNNRFFLFAIPSILKKKGGIERLGSPVTLVFGV
ncbi:hypothetical protein BBH51_06550 [Aggregatibacter actinomycetemcomitans]|uniref:Uncharacterized protein n=1 Tax=Aggregatibacter actinomycetemcomitans TaxID=714 RepID=A0AAC8XWJ4_AGGAC|nr:hypothetical protein [Aggregatibacter actinomycetemcomitans]ANN81577.1 hypothetical protein D7S_02475 [Aggregatibacter actinomycetemcomitans D7S-1]EKX98540.1 hypothetical protein HMPREF9996_00353 [Aggregatibacter actinomycetemcomitans Y4]KND82683.1 hypothetical protein H5P1_0210665 [Aggregatibacter actinomycetemcomitans serotype a str. H5P1]KOE30392.1 hypothetical protein D17P3_0310160 [Aggregatibacter actinomycetemcomitans D17P-3]KOE62565.1 hypothetical protein I63B_0311165 [Aggregatibacte